MTITIEKAQSQAAELCLTILTDAGLIGDNLITKLPAARDAILECLPKMYAVCRQVEGETGKNMYLVSKAVVQMFGRGKWADHNEMMGRVEAAFRALIVEEVEVEVVHFEIKPEMGRDAGVRRFNAKGQTHEKSEILTDGEWKASALTVGEVRTMLSFGSAFKVEAPVVTVEVTEPATATPVDPAVAALVQVAKDSQEGLNNRLHHYQSRICALSLDKLNEFIIVSRMGCIAYEVVNGSLIPCKDLIFAPGSMDEVELSEGLPPHMTVQKRIHAMQEVIDRSKEALKQIEHFLKGVAL